MYVYGVYLLCIYKYTLIQCIYIYRKYLHLYIYIHIFYIIYKYIEYKDINLFVNICMHVSVFIKLGILTWGVYGTDFLLEPASSGQSMNCSFSHFRVGFTRGSGRLPLDFYQAAPSGKE